MQLPVPLRPRLAASAAVLAALLAGCASHPTGSPAPEPAHAVQPTDTGLPAAAARTLGQRFPTLRAVGHSAGHLQVDDADDLAVVLAPPGRSSEPVVAVLVTDAGGAYRVATVSKTVAPGCDTCSATVDIARKRLSVHVTQPADPDFERLTYQFSYRFGDTDGVLRLVGVSAAQPAGDDPIAHGYAVSTDLLTGAKLDTLDPTRGRRERRSTVPPRPAIAFDAFPFTPQALAPELKRLPASAFESPDSLPPAAAALLRARFPGTTVQARSAGPLRTDGGQSLAVVLAPAGGGDPTLALLLAQPGGGFKLDAASGPLTRACRDCETQVLIAHQALMVQTTSADPAGTRIVGWQFAATPQDKSGALRLVGVRTVLASRSDGDSNRYVNTANLLTGDKLDIVEDVVHGRRQRSRHASTVALRPPIPLAGFAFDAGKLDAETRQDLRP